MSCRRLLIETIRHALQHGSEEDVLRCLDVVHPLFKDAFCAFPSRNDARKIDRYLWFCIADRFVASAGAAPALKEVMERVPVESSAVSSIGYDEALRILRIEFKGGRIYDYRGVPKKEHEALMAAESIGTYVNTVIKARYPDFGEFFE